MKLVSFRPDLQDKLEEFLQIVQEARGYKFDRTNLPQDIRDIKAAYQDHRGDFWIIEDSNSIVGSIALRVIDRQQSIGEIKRYFVLPSFQRQGIGGRLMAHAMGSAIKLGLNSLRLDTMKKSEAALIVFRKYGFREIPKYNDNDVAEIFMEKDLTAHEVTPSGRSQFFSLRSSPSAS